MSKVNNLQTGKTVNKKNVVDNKNPLMGPMIIIAFSMICFITSLAMGQTRGKSIYKTFPSEGGLVGPITIEKDSTVAEIKFGQDLPYGAWSSISGEVLDENQKFLYNFTKELWAESGYDSEGGWSEKDTNGSTKITFKKKGTYFLKIVTETSLGVRNQVTARIDQKRGSSLPHLIAGIFSLIIGIILYFVKMDPKTKAAFFDA